MATPILFSDSSFFHNRRMHLSVTGSVAAYRCVDLLRLFTKMGIHVSVSVSKGAKQFVTPLLFAALGAFPVYEDLPSQALSMPFAHLEPGDHCEIMLIAPASANSIAKLACGRCDDIVSAQALAFDGHILIAPAMNPKMWKNPALADNIAMLVRRGIRCITPGIGMCACGDIGCGKLADIADIFWEVLRAFAPQDLAGKKVMVTLGPTREYWDGVRFWSNPSSGRMGLCLALAAYLRGASVHAIIGPNVDFQIPQAIARTDVVSAKDMFACADSLWDSMDYGIFCAAVSDFAPVRQEYEQKIAKTSYSEQFMLPFQKNPDIVATLAKRKRPTQRILAFAAQTTPDMESLAVCAQEKRVRKNADILAANRVNSSESGFGVATNTVFVCDAQGREEIFENQSKSDVAWRLCSWFLQL